MTPKLRTVEKLVISSCVLGPMTINSIFLVLSFYRLVGIQVFFLKAVDYGLLREQRGWCGAHVQLGVYSIAMVV